MLESRLTAGLGDLVVEDCLPSGNDVVAWTSIDAAALCCGPVRRGSPYPLVEENVPRRRDVLRAGLVAAGATAAAVAPGHAAVATPNGNGHRSGRSLVIGHRGASG